MKNTVDLTRTRDFKREDRNPLEDIIFRHFSGKKHILPWRNEIRQITNDRDLSFNSGGLYRETDYSKESLLAVGNKEDRKEFNFRKILEGFTCEKCGVSLDEIPWLSGKYGLCRKCTEELGYNNEKDKICWRNNNKNNSDIKISWKGGIRIA